MLTVLDIADARTMPLREGLRELRGRAGLTQEGLAHAAGLTLSAVKKLEYGEVLDPNWSTMRRLARALGVSLDDLARAEDRPPGGGDDKPRPRGRPKRAEAE